MMRFFSTAVAAALVLTSACTLAQAAAPGTAEPVSKGEKLAAMQFKLLDSNHDDKLSRDEVALFSRLADAFDAADRNHDGFVDFEEIRVFAKAYRAQRDAAKKAAAATAVATD